MWRCLLFLLATGCVATPLPDPPTLDTVFVMQASMPIFFVQGMAGTVDSNATVVAVNLDRTEPPTSVAADPDGGFSLTIMGDAGQVVRMHVVVDGTRSAPVDFALTMGTPTVLAPTLGDCLRIPAAIDFGAVPVGSSRSVRVDLANDCSAEVVLSSAVLRTPIVGLTVSTVPPSVPPSTSAAIVVEAAPSAAGPLEEVLLINLGAPTVGRRAVTLYGSGP